MTTNAIRHDLRQRVKSAARADLYMFDRLMFDVLAPGVSFIGAKHFRVLAAALPKVADGEMQRLLIAIPPRHGKSLLASVVPPAWLLGQDPTAKVICASYAEGLANDFATRTRDLLRSGAYRDVFPGTKMESSALGELRTSAKGYRHATSVGGVVTGKGATCIIIDDPMKAVEASSETVRNGVFEWATQSLFSRFDNPSQSRSTVVVMQRLHQSDLIGRLRDEGGWHSLVMPGEGVERQDFDLGSGKTWSFGPGDLLYPERFDAAALVQQGIDLGEAGFSAQVLQRPVPPGGLVFKLKHFQRYEKPPEWFYMIVQSWDPAMSERETAAFSVCTVGHPVSEGASPRCFPKASPVSQRVASH